MISAISGEISPSPSVREASPLDSSAFAALIAALFAQLAVAPPQGDSTTPDAPLTPEGTDASEPSAELVESADALARVLAALTAAPPSVALAQAPAADASTPAAAAALPALSNAAAPVQLPPALLPAPSEARNNPEAALGREPTTASEIAIAAREPASSVPALRPQGESAPAVTEPAPAQPAVLADASERSFEHARERGARSEPQPHFRVSSGASPERGPASGALFPRPTPEFGLEPVPRDPAAASPAALRAEGSAALALFATDRPAVQQAIAPNSGPILERIAWLAEQGGGSARLHLDPPALGELEIVVRVRGRRVDVHLRAEEASAQQAVLESRDRLVEALAIKDFRVDEFSVGGGSRERSDSGSGDSPRERMAPPPEHSRAQAAAPAPNTARAAALRQATAGSIDLRV
jgi:flagellar hook-length control protein FliK